MAWTKQQLIEEAFTELGMAPSVFDLDPEELQTGLRRLDGMMATWEANGIRCGYALPSGPDASDLDDASGIPDTAAEAVYCSLAIRLAPWKGKVVRSETRAAAAEGYAALERAAAQPGQQQLRSIPAGAGNRGRYRQFTPAPDTSPLTVNDAGNLDMQE